MKFFINNNGGRVLAAYPYELRCSNCGKIKKNEDGKWYFFDYDKKLYCEHCAKKDLRIPLFSCNNTAIIKYQFWLIDTFMYGSEKENNII